LFLAAMSLTFSALKPLREESGHFPQQQHLMPQLITWRGDTVTGKGLDAIAGVGGIAASGNCQSWAAPFGRRVWQKARDGVVESDLAIVH
jgi:hypothetical protein